MMILETIGQRLAHYLSRPREASASKSTSRPGALEATLKPGDVLLIDGNSIISVAIKYLTQSSWSHAALYLGDTLGEPEEGEEPLVLLDVDVNRGVQAVPLSKYSEYNTRICRPVGLSRKQVRHVIDYGVARLGQQYDMKNIIDLARYLIPTPMVPTRWRRRLLMLGSGDPTRAICSSLIAQAFQSVRYPILPDVDFEEAKDYFGHRYYKEILFIRHYSQFTPRDFDMSPYFEIVKPTLESGFKPSMIIWGDNDDDGEDRDVENGGYPPKWEAGYGP